MAPGGSTLGALGRAAAGPLEAYGRMLEAAAADVAGAVTGRSHPDPFALRDPHYIQRTLAAWRLASEHYFRADVQGLDHIPATGPVLLVGNHSGGTVIADTFVFAQSFYDHFGAQRPFFQLAHDLVFKTPGPRALLQRYGTIPASRENMAGALERDAALLVYPGGDHETFRPSWESEEVDFANRTGFIKLALEHDVPVVPVVAIGGQETALFLGQGGRAAHRLGLDRLLRLKVLPAVLGPPFGLTILDFPLRLPLPAKISIRILEPINLGERLGPEPKVEEGYDLITSLMQETLTELGQERDLPVLG
ncbi:MAG: acyltransferase family protein [Actinomycetota bacterium]|nr:acyltransferase family protein [Actinomycetota bacterium]